MRFPLNIDDNVDYFDYRFQDEEFTVTPELKTRLADIATCDGRGNEPLLAGLVLLLLQRMEGNDNPPEIPGSSETL